jgi:dTDP-4-amino-4,6-dideoxygalactose transaminase
MLQSAIPVFADIDPATFNMDPADVERQITSRTRAILVVHLFGNACDITAMADIAERHGLPLIEDCSQSHAIKFNGRYLGTYGDLGCFSLQQSKSMTTGDGGMTITDNDAYDDRMRLFMNKAVVQTGTGHRDYKFLAPTYRMNELTAAVGIPQIEKLRHVVIRRQDIGTLLTSLIGDVPGLEPAAVTPGSEHGYWAYPMRTPGFDGLEFARALNGEGVRSTHAYIGRPIYMCSEALKSKNYFGNSSFPFTSEFTDRDFNYGEGTCPVAEEAMRRMVAIPLNENYSDDDVKDIAGAISKVAGGIGAPRAAPA